MDRAQKWEERLISGVIGHLEGLRKQDLARLDKLYRRRVPDGALMSYDLAEELCELSLDIRREITVFLDEQGRVGLVVVADADALDQVSAIELPAPGSGLLKYTAFHTHLGWKPPTPGDQVTLLQFHFPVLGVLMAGVSEGFSRRFGENPRFCDGAFLLHAVLKESTDGTGRRDPQRDCEVSEPMTARALENESRETWEEWSRPVFEQTHRNTRSDRERALLIGLQTQHSGDTVETMAELRQLAVTAGAEVMGEVLQSRNQPDPRQYLGSGKAHETALLIQQLRADVVIADDELSPAQQRTLEQILRVKVVDRTELILDIFAQRAQSREGQIQVELAQLQYELPRLKGRGRMFSQQTAVGAKGGIATRGPGETKLETDRRLLRHRVTMLEKQAEEVARHRQFQRQSRGKAQLPQVALVGYTNAGKSTLMRTLTKADVLVEDKLFATLDPTTRKLMLPDGQTVLLSDTVGFIRKLPTFLIKSFRATLEEAASADLLLHVWDASHPNRLEHLESVEEVLATLWKELGVAEGKVPPMWTVCNKIDQLPDWSTDLEMLAPVLAQPYAISAQTGEGIPALLDSLAGYLAAMQASRWAEA